MYFTHLSCCRLGTVFPGKEKAIETLQNYGIIKGKEMLTQRHQKYQSFRFNDKKMKCFFPKREMFFCLLQLYINARAYAYIDTTLLNSASTNSES